MSTGNIGGGGGVQGPQNPPNADGAKKRKKKPKGKTTTGQLVTQPDTGAVKTPVGSVPKQFFNSAGKVIDDREIKEWGGDEAVDHSQFEGFDGNYEKKETDSAEGLKRSGDVLTSKPDSDSGEKAIDQSQFKDFDGEFNTQETVEVDQSQFENFDSDNEKKTTDGTEGRKRSGAVSKHKPRSDSETEVRSRSGAVLEDGTRSRSGDITSDDAKKHNSKKAVGEEISTFAQNLAQDVIKTAVETVKQDSPQGDEEIFHDPSESPETLAQRKDWDELPGNASEEIEDLRSAHETKQKLLNSKSKEMEDLPSKGASSRERLASDASRIDPEVAKKTVNLKKKAKEAGKAQQRAVDTLSDLAQQGPGRERAGSVPGGSKAGAQLERSMSNASVDDSQLQKEAKQAIDGKKAGEARVKYAQDELGKKRAIRERSGSLSDIESSNAAIDDRSIFEAEDVDLFSDEAKEKIWKDKDLSSAWKPSFLGRMKRSVAIVWSSTKIKVQNFFSQVGKDMHHLDDDAAAHFGKAFGWIHADGTLDEVAALKAARDPNLLFDVLQDFQARGKEGAGEILKPLKASMWRMTKNNVEKLYGSIVSFPKGEFAKLPLEVRELVAQGMMLQNKVAKMDDNGEFTSRRPWCNGRFADHKWAEMEASLNAIDLGEGSSRDVQVVAHQLLDSLSKDVRVQKYGLSGKMRTYLDKMDAEMATTSGLESVAQEALRQTATAQANEQFVLSEAFDNVALNLEGDLDEHALQYAFNIAAVDAGIAQWVDSENIDQGISLTGQPGTMSSEDVQEQVEKRVRDMVTDPLTTLATMAQEGTVPSNAVSGLADFVEFGGGRQFSHKATIVREMLEDGGVVPTGVMDDIALGGSDKIQSRARLGTTAGTPSRRR